MFMQPVLCFLIAKLVAPTSGECQKPPNVMNADWRFDPSPDSSTQARAIYSCHPGFRPLGNNSLSVDLQKWEWSPLGFYCQEIPDCGQPLNVKENGVVYSPKKTLLGSIIQFRCNFDGDTLEGSDTAECMEDAKWSQPTPQCKRSCDHIYFVHVIWQGSEVSYTEHNHQAVFSCDHGYTAPHGNNVTCQDGIWEPEPWCPKKKPWWCVIYPTKDECTEY